MNTATLAKFALWVVAALAFAVPHAGAEECDLDKFLPCFLAVGVEYNAEALMNVTKDFDCPKVENYFIKYENCSFISDCCSQYTENTKDMDATLVKECPRITEIVKLCDGKDKLNSAFSFAPSFLFVALCVAASAGKSSFF